MKAIMKLMKGNEVNGLVLNCCVVETLILEKALHALADNYNEPEEDRVVAREMLDALMSADEEV